MQLRRDDAADQQREQQRDGCGDHTESARDDAGAEEDRRRHAEKDEWWHRQRLGQRPPKCETDGRRDHRRDEARAHQARRSARLRSQPPAAPAKAPPIAYGSAQSASRAAQPRRSSAPAPASSTGVAVTIWKTAAASAPSRTERPPAIAERRAANQPAPNDANKRYPIARNAPLPTQSFVREKTTTSAIAAAITASQKRSGLADDRERVIRSVQRFGATVIAEDRDVLDADAEPTREVDAGLDREGHARLEPLVVAAYEVRMLVSVEPDPMPGAVDEALTVSGVVDHAARRGIDRRRRCACHRRRIPRLLRAPHDVVDAAHVVIDAVTDVDGARDVGAVPLACASEVENDRVATSDAAIAGLVVGRRTVRPGGDDGECDLLMTFLAQERGEVRADLALRAASELPLEEARERAIRRGRDRA